jgi:hypothetical protein
MGDVLTEDQVRDWIGAERLARLKAGGWLSPGYRFEGFEGLPAYQADYVRLRFEEDKRLHPGSRRPAVRKAHAPAPRGGVPDLVIDRNGVRHLVVRKAAPAAAARPVSPQVEAEFERLQAAARRFLHSRGVPW